MDDAAILALYWARDEEAIAATDRAYGPLCRGLAWNLLHSREDAEECVNDTWHRAWTTIPPQRPESLRAYLCRIVRNLSIDRWRAAQARKRGAGLELLVGELEECLPPAASAEAAVEERELVRCLDRWLDALAPEDRALFLRRYWYGQSLAELAQWAGRRANTLSQRLRRLRLELRETLEKEGITL